MAEDSTVEPAEQVDEQVPVPRRRRTKSDHAEVTQSETATPAGSPVATSVSARGITVPTSFTVSQACSIEGTAYDRGDTITAAVAKTFRKLDVLMSTRILVPTPEPFGRKTDSYGPGAAPRKHPTPTHLSPVERAAL